jgi:hypothetical protein
MQSEIILHTAYKTHLRDVLLFQDFMFHVDKVLYKNRRFIGKAGHFINYNPE